MRISDWSSDVCSSDLAAIAAKPRRLAPARHALTPLAPSLAAVERMSDATGMLQHALYSVPDRRHGYCIDDNARALILMTQIEDLADDVRDRWTTIYARSEEHTSELQSLMRISYAVFCLKKKKQN